MIENHTHQPNSLSNCDACRAIGILKLNGVQPGGPSVPVGSYSYVLDATVTFTAALQTDGTYLVNHASYEVPDFFLVSSSQLTPEGWVDLEEEPDAYSSTVVPKKGDLVIERDANGRVR